MAFVTRSVASPVFSIDVRQVQTLLGHERPETTMLYTRVTNKPSISVVSPLDRVN